MKPIHKDCFDAIKIIVEKQIMDAFRIVGILMMISIKTSLRGASLNSLLRKIGMHRGNLAISLLHPHFQLPESKYEREKESDNNSPDKLDRQISSDHLTY